MMSGIRGNKEIQEGKSDHRREIKLSTKLSVFCAVVLAVCMTISNVISSVLINSAMSKATAAQFNKICDSNVLKIDAVLEECSSISETIISEFQYLYDKRSKHLDSEAIYPCSTCEGVLLTEEEKNAENIIINAIWAALQTNDYLVGVGMSMEPYAFSPAIRDFAPYGVKEDLSTRRIENYVYESYKDREYYTGAMGGDVAFMDAYVDINGTLMYSIGYPIMYQGKFMGEVTLDIKSTLFSMLDETDPDYPSMDVDLVRSNHNIIYSTHADTISKNMGEQVKGSSYDKLSSNMAGGGRFYQTMNKADGEYVCFAAPVKVGSETWYVMSSVLKKEYKAATDLIFYLNMLLSAATIIITILMIGSTLKKMLKPLQEIEAAADSMADGNLQVEIAYSERDDIGSLAESMRTMMRRTRAVIRDLSELLAQIAEGNFQVEMKNKEIYVGDFEPLMAALKNIVDKLNSSLNGVKTASEQVNLGSGQVAAASQALAQGATEQASTVQELFASMEEISKEVTRTAEKAGRANEIADTMGEDVVKSNGKMQEMSEAMQDITEKSGEIEKIIKTIDDIAFQTNILALNAAVEAARAGEAGKGFAVVADEVRNLAQKSAGAAKNTAQLIEDTIQSVTRGGRITEETASELQVLSDNVGQVAKLVQEISKASSTQSDKVVQATKGVEQISSVVQANSATAEECAATSEELSSQASELNNMVTMFRLRDNEYGE